MNKIQRQYQILAGLLIAGIGGSLLTPFNVDPRIGTFSAGLAVGTLIAIYMLRIAELGENSPDESEILDFHQTLDPPGEEETPIRSDTPDPDTGTSVTDTPVASVVQSVLDGQASPGSQDVPDEPASPKPALMPDNPEDSTEDRVDDQAGGLNVTEDSGDPRVEDELDVPSVSANSEDLDAEGDVIEQSTPDDHEEQRTLAPQNSLSDSQSLPVNESVDDDAVAQARVADFDPIEADVELDQLSVSDDPGSPMAESAPEVLSTIDDPGESEASDELNELSVPEDSGEPVAESEFVEESDAKEHIEQPAFQLEDSQPVVQAPIAGQPVVEDAIEQSPEADLDPAEVETANNILNFGPTDEPGEPGEPEEPDEPEEPEEPVDAPATQVAMQPEPALEGSCACACGCDRRSKGGLTDLCGSCIRWWQQQSMRCKCDYTVNQYCTCGAIRHGLRVDDDVSDAA